MIIQTTKRPSPGPATKLVTKAIDEGTLRQPALVVATTDDRPDVFVGARAYRNDRLGDLTGCLTKLSRAAARALFPKHAPLIDGIAFVVGSAPRVERMLRDGVSRGDFVDVASLVTSGLAHARNISAPVDMRAADDGARSDLVRPPDTLDNLDAVLGVIARTRSGVMISGMEPSPFQRMAGFEPRPLAELAKVYGPVNPVFGAGFGLLDVLSDPWFWKSLENGRKPAPTRFRSAGTGGVPFAAKPWEYSGIHRARDVISGDMPRR